MANNKDISPREMVGVPDKPTSSDKIITPAEAKLLTETAKRPIDKKLPARTEKRVKTLVVNKLTGALKEAGYTAGVAAKIIMDAAEATKVVSVTLETDNGDGDGKPRRTLEEVPDHAIRLTAYKMAEETLRRAEAADSGSGEGPDYGDVWSLETLTVYKKLKAKQQAAQRDPLEVGVISVDSTAD